MALKSQPRTLAHWLENSAPLKQLLSGCRQHADLLTLVKSRLPDPLCEHCCAAGLNGSELVVSTDSPAWTGRLRFMQGTLARQLSQVGIHIESMKVNTLPINRQLKQATHPRQSPLSNKNARLIEEISESIGNPDLQAALNRLAKHHR